MAIGFEQSYEVLSVTPPLYLTFSQLAGKPASAYVDFASRFGILGFGYLIQLSDETSVEWEFLDDWTQEAEDVADGVMLWQALKAKYPAKAPIPAGPPLPAELGSHRTPRREPLEGRNGP